MSRVVTSSGDGSGPKELPSFDLVGHIMALRGELGFERERVKDRDAEIDRLRGCLRVEKVWRKEQGDRVEDLQDIVDKMLKTKDGVPVVPWMKVWTKRRGMISQWCITRMDADGWVWLKRCEPCDSSSSPEMGTKHYYGTREAAEAAGGE